MKTQVIKLEPYDDVTSVRDKISWAKTEHILLVIPRRSHIKSRKLDLRLLRRHANLVGARLAIVTPNIDLRLVAKELDIPVFSRLPTAKRKNWPVINLPEVDNHHHEHPNLKNMRRDISSPEDGRGDQPGFRLSLFSMAVLAILAVLSIFIPSATIQLVPITHVQMLTLAVNASPSFTAVNLAGNIPAHSTSAIIDRTKSMPTTGSVAFPTTRAAGTAQFRNLTTSAVTIPAGTVISTQMQPTIRFITTTRGKVDAGVGNSADVPITAMDAGTGGNLPMDALIAIQGDLGASLTVTNPKATTGGSDQKAAIQTASDRTTLRTSLIADILAECKSELQKTLLPGDFFFPDSLADSKVLAETYFPAENQAGDTLSLTLRLQCQGEYVRAGDLNKLSMMLLDVNLPEGYRTASGGLVVQPTSVPITNTNGTTHWDVQVQRLVQSSINSLTVVQIALGHRPATAVKLLERSLPLAQAPVIKLKPSWWPWLPLISFRILVVTSP